MEYGISTAVLKGANAPGANLLKDANGETTGSEPTELVMEGTPCAAPAVVAYERYCPPCDVVVRGEGG